MFPKLPGIITALALCALTPAFAQAIAQTAPGTDLPQGRPTKSDALNQAVTKALPSGATQVARPLAVDLGPLGRVQVVLYRRNANDGLFRGFVFLPAAHNTYRALPLPEEDEAAGNYEQVTTAILAADLSSPDPGSAVPAIDDPAQTLNRPGGADTSPLARHLPSAAQSPSEATPSLPDTAQRALVILFYSHEFGQTASTAFGRVYLYDGTRFRIDEVRSHLLDGVRTAAVVRLRLAPNP